MLIGLTAKKQHGKSSVAAHLVGAHEFVEMSFADPLREMLYQLDPIVYVEVTGLYVMQQRAPIRTSREYVRLAEIVDGIGWDRAKEEYPEVRRLMQRMGTEAGRTVLGEDVWVRELEKRVAVAMDEGRDVVVPDMRFPNELEVIKALGGRTVRIHREGVTPGPGADHSSETALDGTRVDWVIHNDGTLTDLGYRADWMLRHFNMIDGKWVA